jgi:putative transposase
MNFQRDSHFKYSVEYHFIWRTKYSHQVLQGDVGARFHDIVHYACKYFNIQLLREAVRKDHVYILVSVPPKMSSKDIMHQLKNCTSDLIFEQFPYLRRRYWEQQFWAHDYCCVIVDDLMDQLVLDYLVRNAEKRGRTSKTNTAQVRR